MNQVSTKDYTFKFESSHSSEKIFNILLDVASWWVGYYSETITGNSSKLDDEFIFQAGDGVHYSKQKLVELIPNQRVVWLVTESRLGFLENTNEWNGTKICFEISIEKDRTQVQFSHIGLVPNIECYKDCSSAWTQYMQRLSNKLK